MKHLSRWHSVTAGTATAALAAGAFGLSSILTGPGASPAPIELSAAERSGAAVGDDGSTTAPDSPTAPSVVSEASPASAASPSPASNDSADDAGPRVEARQDQRVAPTPEVSPSPDSPSPDSPSPASVDSPSPASVDSPSPASVDSPSPASVDSPDEVVARSRSTAVPAVVPDSPESPALVSPASVSAASASADSVSADSVSASTSVDSAS